MISDETTWHPSYIGIGTMKAASAWIFQCLREHPEISGTQKKEVHFFDLDVNYRKGITFYRSFFSNEGIAGEFSPSYLYEPDVPARIHVHFPSIKMIACLRNPADRAWSHYRYAIQMHGRLSAYPTFKDAYTADKSLAEMGRYAEQLERYFKYFQEDQIKIVFYEDLKAKPIETIQSIYRFLGVQNPTYIPEAVSSRRNKTGDRQLTIKYKRSWRLLLKARMALNNHPKIESFMRRHGLISGVRKLINKSSSMDRAPSKPTAHPVMSKSDRALVIDSLSTDITKLERITGRDLSSWKT